MKVQCLYTDGSHLSQEYYLIGYTKQSKFDTTAGSEYSVYAVSVWNRCLMYLICDDFNVPNWYPAGSFKVVQKRIPKTWQFMYFNNDEYMDMIMGYPKIVEDREHYVALVEREPNALSIFNEVKLEVDAELENQS